MGETKTERFTGKDFIKGVNRVPVNFNYAGLNWDFLKLLGEIAVYAADKYGSAEQYADIRPQGEQSPLNHIMEHARQYMARETHDKFVDLKYHLAAIAYNAMMEFYYLEHGGPTNNPTLYEPKEEAEDWPGIRDEVVPTHAVAISEKELNNILIDNIELSEPTPIQKGKEKLTKFFGGLGGREREGTLPKTGN